MRLKITDLLSKSYWGGAGAIAGILVLLFTAYVFLFSDEDQGQPSIIQKFNDIDNVQQTFGNNSGIKNK